MGFQVGVGEPPEGATAHLTSVSFPPAALFQGYVPTAAIMKLLAMVVLLVTVCSLEGEFVIRRKGTKAKKMPGLVATQLSVLLQMSVPTVPKRKAVPFRKSKNKTKSSPQKTRKPKTKPQIPSRTPVWGSG